jgi:hypothetical protein
MYPKGSLHRGWQRASPSAAFAGALTGQNLTAQNPNASRAGTPAEWNAATFSIGESSDELSLGPVDGDYVGDVWRQLRLPPKNATHILVSAGGNDALGHAHKLRGDYLTSKELFKE